LTATGGGGAARYDDADEELYAGSDEGGAQAPRAPEALLPTDAWLDFSSLVLRDPDNAPRKGRLERRKDELGVDLSAARRRVEQLPNPLYGCDPRDARGMFDHRYDAAGLVDVLSNAQPQRVSLQTAETGCTPVLRTVPRADARAYREVELPNPFQAPLLAGPVDVFVEGALLRTSDLAAVDRGGLMKFGLGLEERVRVARNARVEESTRGLLGGSTHLVHHIHIEVTSNLGHPIRLTVLDRVPVTDDKEVEVKLLGCEPQAARYEQLDVGHPVRGGLRWVLELPHGQKRDLRFSYSVELSSKSELIGGNRRE
jgi:hypothetical protein